MEKDNNQIKLTGNSFINGYVGNEGGVWIDGSYMEIYFHEDNKCKIKIGVSCCDDDEENIGHWEDYEYEGKYIQDGQDVALDAFDQIIVFKTSGKGIVAQGNYYVPYFAINDRDLFHKSFKSLGPCFF